MRVARFTVSHTASTLATSHSITHAPARGVGAAVGTSASHSIQYTAAIALGTASASCCNRARCTS